MAQWRAAVSGAALVLAMVGLDARSADEPKSGPPPGGGTPPFGVQDVTGPAKGTKLCYV
jgi:hypothetical protein